MNKKGFTLVELLAVIAILAILVVMAMPNVLDMFNSSKKSTFKNEVKSILKQVSTDYVNNSMGATDNGAGIYKNFGTDKNELSIDTQLKYYVNVNANGEITAAHISNGKLCYSKTSSSDVTINYSDEFEPSDVTSYALCNEVLN